MTVRISLGTTYSPNMWDLRKQIDVDRKAGKAVVTAEVVAPITSAVIGVALRASDLYLIGIRTASGQWFEFAPDTHASHPSLPPAGLMLPNSRRVMAGAATAMSSYRALRLPEMIKTNRSSFAGGPIDLVNKLAFWDGNLNHDFLRLHVCLLIFAICEALRFRQIDEVAYYWTGRAISANGEWPVFKITKEMLDLVQSWSEKVDAIDGGLALGVTAWPANRPDRLIT